MGVMLILNKTGHGEVAWDVTDPGSVAVAEREFTSLAKKGYSAFVRTEPDSQDMFRINTFAAEADEILWIKPLVGG